jgi:serine/threonine-protein kinase PpkA
MKDHPAPLLRSLLRFIFILVGLGSNCLAANEEFETLKRDIQSRSGQIQEAKARGELLEAADGMLTAGSSVNGASTQILQQENLARRRMFDLIATRTGESSTDVGTLFALRAARQTLPSAPSSAATAGMPSTPVAVPVESSDSPFVPVQPGSRVPLRVLTRPLAVLHAGPEAGAPTTGGAIPAFSALLVLRRENGWYQVADKLGGPSRGWMKEADVMEWKHHLVASFTHPDGRNKVVVFRGKEALERLAQEPPDQRAAEMKRYQMALASPVAGRVPEEVLGAEPDGWARMQNQFFLLPVIDQKLVEMDGRDASILRVAAATHERGQRQPPAADRPVETAGGPKVDIVFVMDLTRSMGPFVERTRQMLIDIASSLSGGGIATDAVSLGLWGYRDDPQLCEGIGFNTRNFTPDLQSVPAFVQTLESVQETKVDSIDYAEDVFAGVTDAVTQTKWRSGAVRLILLVGDAPGRGHKEEESECAIRPRPNGNASGMNVEELRALATAQAVNISTIYLESPKWRQFTERGERQFRILGRNPSSDRSAVSYTLLNAADPADYAACASSFASQLAENLRMLSSQKSLPRSAEVPLGRDDPKAAGRQMADNVFRGAMIEWASSRKDLPVPRDIDGWVLDKDPADPSITALDAAVLLNRDQLDSLKRLIDDLVNAGIRAQISSEDLFTALLAVAATGARDPGRLRNAKSLQEAGMIPDFLQGLPYKSDSAVMALSQERWQAMSGDEQSDFIKNIESKLRYYQGIYEDTGKWAKINPNDDEASKVYAVPLKNLP